MSERLLVVQSQSFEPYKFENGAYKKEMDTHELAEGLAEVLEYAAMRIRREWPGMPSQIVVKFRVDHLDADWQLIFWGSKEG